MRHEKKHVKGLAACRLPLRKRETIEYEDIWKQPGYMANAADVQIVNVIKEHGHVIDLREAKAGTLSPFPTIPVLREAFIRKVYAMHMKKFTKSAQNHKH